MLIGKKYYHSATRNLIIAFGDLFNSIIVDRLDASNNIVNRITVPILYGPREAFLSKLRKDPKHQIVLPRLSFQITGISYDSVRKMQTVNKTVKLTSNNSIMSWHFAPVPYNVSLELGVFARNSNDGLQIIEQILPYFTPEWNITIDELPSTLSIARDVPLILESVQTTNEFEGDFGEGLEHTFLWTLNFVAKLQYWGPVTNQGQVTKVIVHTYAQNTGAVIQVSDYEDPTSTILVNAASRITVVPDPLTANASSDYGYTVSFLHQDESN